MKKILLFGAFIILATTSYGVHYTRPAYAQSVTPTVTPEQAAALQQQLQVARAQLVKLQMEAGQVPVGDAGLPAGTAGTPTATVTPTPATTPVVMQSAVSAQDLASINSGLTALKAVLITLQSKIASNPQLVANNSVAMVSALKGIGTTLALIGQAVGNSNVSANGGSPATSPVAMTSPTPAAATPAAGAPAATTPAGTVAITPTTPAAVTPAATPSAQTAQASSLWGFITAHWPTILIILLVILILAILLWPSGEKGGHSPRAPEKSSGPVRPVTSTTMQSTTMHSSSSPASTPVSTVVAAPGQRMDVQQTRVTVVRPQQQQPQNNNQKKTA